jgi:hypothetical protein
MADFPTEAKYMRIKNYNDKVLARHTTRISPFNGSIFGPRAIDRILFNIPSETGMEIDMDTLMFHFDAQIDLGAAALSDTRVMFLNSIESIIQTLRIRKGTSFLIEDIQRYNYLDSMFMNYLSSDYNNCVGNAMMGIGPVTDRFQTITTAAAAPANRYNTKKNYCIPFRLSGISNYSGLISTSLIDQVSAFQFEIELAPASDAIQVNRITIGAGANGSAAFGGAPADATYIINNCYLSYDLVRMSPDYHAQLQSSINRGIPLQIPYKTWRTSMYSIDGTNTSFTLNINDTVKSLNSVFVAFFRQDEQGKLTISGKDRKHKPANLKTVQLQLGSFYYPLQPCDCTLQATQAFLELQKALGLAFVRSEYNGPYGFDGKYYSDTYPNTSANLLTPNGFAENQPTALLNPFGVAYTAPIAGTNGLAYTANYAGVGVQAGTVLANDAPASSARFATEAGGSPCTEFLIGFNMRKVLDATEGEIVGTDIQSSGSGLMTLRLEFNTGGPAVAYNIVVASLYDAVLEIQSNQQAFRVE